MHFISIRDPLFLMISLRILPSIVWMLLRLIRISRGEMISGQGLATLRVSIMVGMPASSTLEILGSDFRVQTLRTEAQKKCADCAADSVASSGANPISSDPNRFLIYS